jgi:hypothetical protein
MPNFLDGDESYDPHKWFQFTRTHEQVSETTPGEDAQFIGGNDYASATIEHDLTNISSITYQVLFYIKPLNKFRPGPTYTNTPPDPGEKIDQNGSPFGIILISATRIDEEADGKVDFYVSKQNRDLGGN